ncbi:MAG: YihY/virulence factor BrkB family protein [Bacteroidales bacterium]
MLSYLKVPVGWGEILRRTLAAVNKDDVLALSAGLAYSFFFALFPALIFIVALASFFPLQGLVDQLISRAGNVIPDQMMALVTGQMKQISNSNHGGLLTFGLVLTVFSVSSGMAAVIDALNHAYDITDSRPWWKVRLVSIALVVALGVFLLVSLALVMVGPELAGRVATWVHIGPEFALAWRIAEWPVVFVLVVTAVGFVYYFGPDAEQDWVWITPGSLVATVLWILASLGFRLYIAHFNSYNATYGAIGGVMIALLWLYITGIMLLVGAELNAEIEHASPYGKEPGEKRPGERRAVRRKIGIAAARAWEQAQRVGRPAPSPTHAAAQARSSMPVPSADKPRPARRPAASPAFSVSRERVGTSRWVLGGVIAGEVALALARMFRKTRA